jgi:hypothetical protein
LIERVLAGGDRDYASAEVTRAFYIARCIAYDDKLVRVERLPQVLADPLCGNGGQVVALFGVAAERAPATKIMPDA